MNRRTIIAAVVVLGTMLLFPATSGAALEDTDKAMAQALYFAVSQGEVNQVAALRDKCPDLDITLKDADLEAEAVFNYQNEPKHKRREVEKLINSTADYNYWPVLTWAVVLSVDKELDIGGEVVAPPIEFVYPDPYVYTEIIRILLKSGANPNASDRNGTMPLHWAAWSGNYPVVKMLLANGANPRILDKFGRSPLDWALMSGQADIVRILPKVKPGKVADSDGDGVPDGLDQCPNTPNGAPVDDRGCWMAANSKYFDFNSAVVKKKYYPIINKTAMVLKRNPQLNVELAGHTDNVGSDQYNQKLGLRRAKAVKRLLVKFGVEAKRITVTSYGESQPVATNDTAHGRAKNRRVEVRVPDSQMAAVNMPEDSSVVTEVVEETVMAPPSPCDGTHCK